MSVKSHMRIRRKISGSAERPRLNIYRSLSHIYAQVIDDVSGTTLVSASTVDRDIASQVSGKSKQEQAALVGAAVAARSLAVGIEEVVFDRGGFRYHGRVQKLADAARKAGLRF